MFCLRCTRSAIALSSPSSLLLSRPTTTSIAKSTILSQAQRTFASFTNTRPTFALSKRPTLPSPTTSNLSLSTILETPSSVASSALPAVSGPGALLQSRGPKRDTFDPSHRVRKRRHGFLCRVRTRTGRNLLKRRRLKKRSTLGH